MRIAVVSQHFPPENSGNASRVSDMVDKLADLGARVTVIAPHPTFPTGTHERSWRLRRTSKRGDVTLVNLWAWQPRARDPGFLSRVAYYLTFPLHAAFWAVTNLRRFDAIVCSMPPTFIGIPGLLVSLLSRRKRFVVEVRDLWIDAAVSLGFVKEASLATRLSRALERRLLARASLVAVTTDDIARKTRSRHAIDDGRIVVVPNGVDTRAFRPVDTKKRPQFVYAGNIGHAQDLETVIRAVAIVRRSHPAARLVLAGGGDTRAALESLAIREGVGDAVDFPGVIPRAEVPRLLSESAAGLAPLRKMPGLEYAVPTKTYEYMGCGIPFIGTGAGEIAALAEASGAGWIADNTPGDLARAMCRVLDHPDEAAEMGKRGRAYVEERYDRAAIARRYLEAMKGV